MGHNGQENSRGLCEEAEAGFMSITPVRPLLDEYRTVSYRIVRIRQYRIVSVRYLPYRTLLDHTIANLNCSSGFFARANHLLHRFRTVLSVSNGVIACYESRVRLISPFDLVRVCACVRACVYAYVCVFIVLYSYMFRHGLVLICLVSIKIQILDPYELLQKCILAV
jgi:hypothetical protein